MCVFRRTFYGKSYANSEDLGDQFRILLRGFLFHLDYLIESLRVTLMIIHLFGNYPTIVCTVISTIVHLLNLRCLNIRLNCGDYKIQAPFLRNKQTEFSYSKL